MDLQYLPGADVPPIQFDDDDEISPEEAQMVGLSAKTPLMLVTIGGGDPCLNSTKRSPHLNLGCKC